MLTYLQKHRKLLESQADTLLDMYLLHGPERVREYLELESEVDFTSVFDYLVFEKQILMDLVRRYEDFFGKILAEHGPQHIRRSLKIEDAKYGMAFAPILDFLGVEKENLFVYVIRHKDFLYETMMMYNTEMVRKILCIEGVQYDDVWLQILDLFFADASGRMMELQKQVHIEKFLEQFSEGRQQQQILPLE